MNIYSFYGELYIDTDEHHRIFMRQDDDIIALTAKEAVELANYILDNVDLCRHCGSKLPCYCERDE